MTIEGTFHFAVDDGAAGVHYDVRPANADVVLIDTTLLLELVEAYVKMRGRSWLLIRHDMLGSAGPSEPVVRGYQPAPIAEAPRAIGAVIEGTIVSASRGPEV